MKTPVEIIVSSLNSRRHETNLIEIKNSDPSKQKEESIVRRIAKRISKSENSRQFCFDGDDEVL